jgi:hypothetical protein
MTSVFNFRIQLLLSSCENRLSVNGLERLHPIPPKRHRHLGLTESVNEKLYELNFRTMCTISGSPSNGNRNFAAPMRELLPPKAALRLIHGSSDERKVRNADNYR